MSDRKYYHDALEYAFLDGAALEEKINKRIDMLSGRKEVRMRLPKRLIIALVAAAALLIAGTAFAVAISRMQEIRDGGLNKIDTYEKFVNDGLPADETLPDNSIDSDYTVPLGIGMNDENGNWQPTYIPDLNATVQVGDFTIRLDTLSSGGKGLSVQYFVVSDTPRAFRFAPFYLSINGSEPIKDSIGDTAEHHPEKTPPSEYTGDDAKGMCEYGNLTFRGLQENPLRPDSTFGISSELNGVPFTLTYTLTAEKFEQLRQETLNSLNNYATLLENIPEDTIPVGAECNGYRIVEIAVKDHWLYYTDEPIADYWKVHESGRESAPYGIYDRGGHEAVIDGMLCEDEYISSKKGEDEYTFTTLSRVHLPYSDKLPNQSLVTILGAPFRIEWETGKVTLPKNETEYLAWRRESEALSAKLGDYDANFIAKPNAAADTFTVTELNYMNRTGLEGTIGLILETEKPVQNPLDGMDRQPIVTVAGAVLESMSYDYGMLDKFSGGTQNGGKRVGFIFYGPAYRTLPETFDVTVTWNGSTVTFIMQKSDLVRCYDEEEPWERFHKDYKVIFGL